MNLLNSCYKWISAPYQARIVPYGIFVLLTHFQGQWGESSLYWVYILKTIVGILMLSVVWKTVDEMRWKCSFPGLLAGVFIFGVWVIIGNYARSHSLFDFFQTSKPVTLWNPQAYYSDVPILGLFFVAMRFVGTVLVVPMLEEVFFRSFVYRYFQEKDFLKVPFTVFSAAAFGFTSILFASVHSPADWIGAVICAVTFQGLVLWKNRLGDAIFAHAIANLLLGIWVLSRGEWYFW